MSNDANSIEPAALARELTALRRELPALPTDSAGPVFREPWEAHAFAMALALHARGAFTWKEWAAMLAVVIAEARASGEADSGEDYYRHWLTALERIVAHKGIVDETLLALRRHEWEDAARNMPHGQPIVLAGR